MKLGIISAIYDGFTFEEAVENAVQNGCECMEVACWPQGKAERRYAGVSHIDVDNMSPEYIAYIKDFCAKKGIEISSLAFYPNTMDGDLQKREANIAHLKKVINMSALLGVNMVTTFIGRDQTKTVELNDFKIRLQQYASPSKGFGRNNLLGKAFDPYNCRLYCFIPVLLYACYGDKRYRRNA